jgi:prepilin-type N-terminal cleavage/methylation domain-containing protein
MIFIRGENKGMSLVEVLVAMVVAGLVSFFAWMSSSVITRSNAVAQNRSTAVNLLQKSQEELRVIIQEKNSFDSIEHCQFPQTGLEPLEETCGLEDIRASFPGFIRTANFSVPFSSTEIKEVVITVSWTYLGRPYEMTSTMLLARPPERRPGNVLGRVTDESAGSPVDSVKILLTHLTEPGKTRTTISGTDNGTENYNFKDSLSGVFTVPAGDWEFTATCDGYEDYRHADAVSVQPDQETRVDFGMKSKPGDARLTVRLTDLSGNAVPLNWYAYVEAYHEGGLFRDKYGTSTQARNVSRRTWTFDADQITDDGLSLTVRTRNALRAGWVGDFSCEADNTYDAHGWSSAIVQDDGTVHCGSPRSGDAASDRITLHYEDDITVDVPLASMPLATLSGRMIDSDGSPLVSQSVRIYAQWSNGWAWYPYPITATTDAAGNYSVSIPAAAEIFPDDEFSGMTGRVRVRAYAYVGSVKRCCGVPGMEWRYSDGGWLTVGPVNAGGVVRQDFVFVTDQASVNCGNLQGTVRDDSAGSVMPGVEVTVVSQTEHTDSAGGYLYACPDGSAEPYLLRTGSQTVILKHDDFYDYDSRGSWWYADGPEAQIVTDSLSVYNGRIWPLGRGTIRVLVRSAGSGAALAGMNVVLNRYAQTDAGNVFTAQTDAAGQVVFENMNESWPPLGLPDGDAHYNYTARQHSLEVSDPDGGRETVTLSGITLDKGQFKEIVITMPVAGGGM